MHWITLWTLVAPTAAAVLGIDYGGEFTKSNLVAPGIPFEIVLTADSKRKDASGLVIKPQGDQMERYYGSSGLGLSIRYPEYAAYYLKTLLGAQPEDLAVKQYHELHPGLKLIRTARNTLAAQFDETEFSIEELIAMNFGDIKRRAIQMLRNAKAPGEIKNIAVTVPANFGMRQRRALEDAVDLADLKLIEFVHDGTAVALNYVSSRQFGPEKQYFVVYDMGATTTTSTLFSIRNPGVPILEVEGFGTAFVGGQTVTNNLRDILIDRFLAKTELSRLDLTPRAMNRLWRESDRTKAILSANTESTVYIESLVGDNDLNIKVSRLDLEDAAKEVIDAIAPTLLKSLTTFDGNHLPAGDLVNVILAGGGTRMPVVQEKIRAEVGDVISKNVNADEAATMGVALRGVAVSGIFKSKAIKVLDKTMRNFSVRIGEDEQVLFPRGSLLDSHASVTINNLTTPILLIEEGDVVGNWTVPKADDALRALDNDISWKCLDNPKLTLRFSLSGSGLAHLAEVKAHCSAVHVEIESRNQTESHDIMSSESRFEEAKEKSMPEFTKTETNVSGNTTMTTSSAAPSRERVRYLSLRPGQLQVTSLTTVQKQQIRKKLIILDEADNLRHMRDSYLNELEAEAYKLRELNSSASNEIITWIDTTHPSIKDLELKLEETKSLIVRLSAKSELSETAATKLEQDLNHSEL